MFELLDPGCNGVIPTSKLDSVPLETYREAFEYIINVADEPLPGRTVGEWEEGEPPPFPHGHGSDTATPPATPPSIPPSQQEKEEL